MDLHKDLHICKGDIEPNTEYVPQKVGELRVHSDLALYSLILQHDGLARGHGGQENDDRESPEESLDDDDGDFDFGDGDLEGFSSSLVDYEEQERNDLLLNSLEDQNTPIHAIELLSKVTRNRILEQNTTLWNNNKYSKVVLRYLSHNCLGPKNGGKSLTGFEKCPNGVVVDFDSSRLRLVSRGFRGSHMSLDNRCVTCRAAVNIEKFFAGHEIQLDSGSDFCGAQGCDQPSFQASGAFSRHLFNRTAWNYRNGIAQENSVGKMRSLRETFNSAAEKKWVSPPEYDIVRRRILEIEQGKRPGSDLVALDIEFSPASRQLWEAAMIERVSGKVLLNACVTYENGLDHQSSTDNPFLKSWSQSKAATVYSPSRPGNIDRLKAHEIALRLRKAGITQDTIILVWHISKVDLTITRDFLVSAGYPGILPPDENCITMIQLFRKNLPVGPPGHRLFPLGLEILFPTMFPNHHLIGLNHRALEDCEQTRLEGKAFDELCKPLSKRSAEWRPEAITNIAQRSILGWLQKEPPADEAEGEINAGKPSAPGQEAEASKSKRKRVEEEVVEEGEASKSERTRIGEEVVKEGEASRSKRTRSGKEVVKEGKAFKPERTRIVTRSSKGKFRW